VLFAKQILGLGGFKATVFLHWVNHRLTDSIFKAAGARNRDPGALGETGQAIGQGCFGQG
jgi:hypothetical protein